MKNIRRIVLLLLFVLVCPAFVFGCGELKFEDVPYVETELTGEEIVTTIDDARTYMISSLELKAKIETVNTYSFYKTKDDKVQNREIKDVITTTLGNAKSNPAVTKIETVRYENGTEKFKEIKTYVRTTLTNNEGYKSFCYTYREDNVDEEKIITRNRSEYDSAYLDFSRLFDNAIVVAKAEEIDVVSSKVFEDTTYYKLEASFEGYEAIFNRFEKNTGIQNNPTLYSCLEPTRDSAMPFRYEFGINASNYISYSKLSYNIVNDNNERYLSVSSESRVNNFGDSVATLEEPADVNDYTVETFMRTLQQEKSYMVYKTNVVDTSYTKTTAIKMENPPEVVEGEGDNNDTTKKDKTFDYSVKVENYNSGVSTQTDYYYIKYDTDLDSHKVYKLDLATKTYVEDSSYYLALLNFDFELDLAEPEKAEDLYTYKKSTSNIKVKVAQKEVDTISTMVATEDVILVVDGFGNDTTDLHMVESLNGFTVSQPAGEGN